MKTVTIMGIKAKQYMAVSLSRGEFDINRARISVSGSNKQPNYPGQLTQVRQVEMRDLNNEYSFDDGSIKIFSEANVPYPLMWVFPDGVGAVGSTITIQLYNSEFTPQIGINIGIEGGLPSGVLYMENMAIVFQGDE